jgi:hypothetical protein
LCNPARTLSSRLARAGLAGVGAIWAHPPEGRKAIVDGKIPSQLAQEYYQPESPTPRLLPPSVTESFPPRYAPPTAGVVPTVAIVTDESTPPFQLVSASATSTPILTRARLAFGLAESHYASCNVTEAQKWYREVIRIAPGSSFALVAAARLNRKLDESPEPPFADSTASDNSTVRNP